MEAKDFTCPHCNTTLDSWLPPPDTGWEEIFVCPNNECPYFKGSDEQILGKRDDSNLGVRYAIDPCNDYKPFNLLSYCPF
jgi:hypothetical protein